jgi:ribosomal protein S27AE
MIHQSARLIHEGHCPKCGKAINPTRFLERNTLRRDVLECPNCQARILKCRFPGCQDYALGGKVWDNDFCPNCTKEVAQAAIMGGLTILLGRFTSRRLPPWVRT